jgi:hypothetical protein
VERRVPRYLFRWENFDPALLDALCAGKDRGDLVAAAYLRAIYGSRPKEVFVADNWPTLRDVWLANTNDARETVATTLHSSVPGVAHMLGVTA